MAGALLAGAPAEAEIKASRRAVHQPGLFVLPAGRQAVRRLCRAHGPARALLQRRLLGLPRLEGHAGQPRQHRTPAQLRAGARRRPGLHAAGGDRRPYPRRRLRTGPTIDAALAKYPDGLPVPLSLSSTGDAITVNIGAAGPAERPRCRTPTLWLVMYDRAVTVPIERGENSGTHDHLQQRGEEAPPDRHVEGRERCRSTCRRARSSRPTSAAAPCCCRPRPRTACPGDPRRRDDLATGTSSLVDASPSASARRAILREPVSWSPSTRRVLRRRRRPALAW